MTALVRSCAVVAAALWVGAVACIGLVIAPYLFALAARSSPAVPNTGVAADLIGPLLHGADAASMVMGAGLLASLGFLRRRGELPLAGRFFVCEISAAVAAASAAVNYFWTAPQINAIRGSLNQKYEAFHLADRSDALFKQFSRLHQFSTTCFLIGLAAALICLVCMTQFRVAHRKRDQR